MFTFIKDKLYRLDKRKSFFNSKSQSWIDQCWYSPNFMPHHICIYSCRYTSSQLCHDLTLAWSALQIKNIEMSWIQICPIPGPSPNLSKLSTIVWSLNYCLTSSLNWPVISSSMFLLSAFRENWRGKKQFRHFIVFLLVPLIVFLLVPANSILISPSIWRGWNFPKVVSTEKCGLIPNIFCQLWFATNLQKSE